MKIQSQPLQRFGVVFLLIAATAEFLARGPVRIEQSDGWNDFVSPYIQSRLWVHGEDPYRSGNLVRFWPASATIPQFVLRESGDNRLVERRGIPSPYPPTTFVLLAPLVLLPWKAALGIWITVNVFAVGITLLALAKVAGIGLSTLQGLLFLALCVGLAPVQTGLATANPAILGIALAVVALWFAARRQDAFCGLMIAGSMCLKPTIGVCFLFFYLVARRWKVVATACGVSALIALVAVGRMLGVSWFTSYAILTKHMFAGGSINDFSTANPIWFQMVNLQGPVFVMTQDAWLANLIVLLVGISLLAAWTVLRLSSESEVGDLLAVSALSMVSLLPTYHRLFDASLLILPIAWAMSSKKETGWPNRLLTISLTLPFLVPGGVLLGQLSDRLRIPQYRLFARCWQGIAVAHETWCLLFLGLLLLYQMRGPRPTTTDDGRIAADSKSPSR